MKYGFPKQYLAEIRRVLGRFPEVERGILIYPPDKGRRYHKGGLVEIAVEGKVDWVEGAFIQLYFDEVISLPYCFDIFDPTRIEPGEFADYIKEHGVVFYEKKPRPGRPLKTARDYLLGRTTNRKKRKAK